MPSPHPEASVRAYRAAMSKLAESTCAPFWWSLAQDPGAAARILNNGTISYVDTGTRKIGVSANHVYRRYLEHLSEHGASAVECQFGGSTIQPERRMIGQSQQWDIVTFEIPEVFVGASVRNPKTYHHAPQWPPRRVCQSDVVLYGGASRWNRASRSESSAKRSGRTLRATSRPSFVSWARYTSPMPPWPMRAVTS